MVELLYHIDRNIPSSAESLLKDGEVILIVDDSPEVGILLQGVLENHHFPSILAHSAAELSLLLTTHNVALILLDIGLPDKDGNEILSDLAQAYPDLGIIMLTGSTDLQVALDCLRQGADDYLTKPINIDEIIDTIKQTLVKRRLSIDNQLFQKQLEATNFRTQFLHHLNLKLNTAYLSTIELDDVLRAILVGITSEEGLQFNRAFLALFDETESHLTGKLAIGPSSREDAGRVWDDIKEKQLSLDDIIKNIQSTSSEQDIEVNKIVKQLQIPAHQHSHPLIRACRERKSILVEKGIAEGQLLTTDLSTILSEDTFVIVPLFSPSKSLGVIIADNFVTRESISTEDIQTLEIFASQASLAIEHSNLYQAMVARIDELEMVTHELERSKDLLVDAERYSALGHMSAQLVHAIRNPITSIGGTARLLLKKTSDDNITKFLNVITKEVEKIESTLVDLFSFVEEGHLQKQELSLHILLRKCVMVFYAKLKKEGIEYDFDFAPTDITLYADAAKLKQLFVHLIRNGIEAMPGGGLLTVKTEEMEDQYLIKIIDSGHGIPSDNIALASDPFFTTKTYGTGMGLTLVKQIVKLHKASFSLEHSDTGGMHATIIFPKTAPPEEHLPPSLLPH